MYMWNRVGAAGVGVVISLVMFLPFNSFPVQ